MAAVGGSIESITLNGRVFAVAADAEGQRKLGGFENEVQSNGNGTARIVKTRVPWGLDGITIEVDDSRQDDEFLQDLMNLKEYFPIAITFASGVVYSGRGTITGESQTSSQNATKSISLMGPDTLSQQ